MVTTNTIGGSSGKTWATVRAPVFPGTGFTGSVPPYPNENWKTSRSAGYPNALTGLMKAFPFYGDGMSMPAYSASTGIGLKGGYLNLGAGRYYGIPQGPIENGNNYSVSSFAYDHETFKATLLGATVNVTYQQVTGGGPVPVTVDVTVTSDMFPADVNGNQDGVFVTADIYNDYSVNSLTLP